MMTSAAMCLILTVLAVSVAVTATTAGSEPTVQFLASHSGHFNLTRASQGASLFYFFFPATERKGTEPLVIWLQGGPGVADEVGLFYLNGPVHLNDDMSLKWNDFSWNKASNILYVDQPAGTGFSSVVNKNDICRNQDCVSNDLYKFLQGFLKKHPGLAKKDFYITGESFAGHYIPAFASRIQRGNKAREGIHINLKGIAIGNGCTNPEIQYSSLGVYAQNMGLINSTIYAQIRDFYLPDCLQTRKQCLAGGGDTICTDAVDKCHTILNAIIITSGRDEYDVRRKCQSEKDCANKFPAMEKFLNEPYVKHSLRVGSLNFSSASDDVYNAMLFDKLNNLDIGIPALLEDDIKMLIYVGEYDLSCNWLGNTKWVEALDWWGKGEFVKSSNVSFIVDGVEAGLLRSYKPIDFLIVHNAGHMVPKDQPKVAFEIIKRWMAGKLGDIE